MLTCMLDSRDIRIKPHLLPVYLHAGHPWGSGYISDDYIKTRVPYVYPHPGLSGYISVMSVCLPTSWTSLGECPCWGPAPHSRHAACVSGAAAAQPRKRWIGGGRPCCILSESDRRTGCLVLQHSGCAGPQQRCHHISDDYISDYWMGWRRLCGASTPSR